VATTGSSCKAMLGTYTAIAENFRLFFAVPI
jgi:hypothetical protein